MLEKTILNVAINIFYLGPSINGVNWVRDFTNKLYRQVLQRLVRFFSTLANTVIIMCPLLTVLEREIKFVCICITSFSSCIVSSWPLPVLVFPGLMPHMICLLNFNILSGGGCMLIDFGQF